MNTFVNKKQIIMQKGIKLSLYINYFVFAILLNSVGIVILKSQKVYGVDEISASTLELFKDLPIAIVSFLMASFLPKIGYKRAMMIALSLVTLGCMSMYFGNSFWSAKVLFASVGVAFALIKVSVYASIGLVTNGEKEHNQLMSSIEGVFMYGIALAYFLFPAFNNEANSNDWLNVYPVLACACLISMLLLSKVEFGDNELSSQPIIHDFKQMLGLITKTLILVFVIAAFFFVVIEQGIMTWLPTFNNTVLKLPENISIMMASILAITLGVGRQLAGYLSSKYSWHYILIACLICAMMMVIFILPQTVKLNVGKISSIIDIPLLGFAFPVVGLFIAPIYPLLNSAILSHLPKNLHAPMTGLIVIFSALGGTLGSRIIGYLFKNVGADQAFYYTLIPMIGLVACILLLKKMTAKS
jgi:MFS transporter, FHS family, glucose/mannose:H+ symporter